MSNAPRIRIARIYDGPEAMAGARLLVDRVWPRGLAKSELELDDWVREVAPSAGLRKWFAHDAAKWAAFRERYRDELDRNAEAVERCLDWCRKGPVTLLFAAEDREHNQAVVLRDYLAARLTTGEKTHVSPGR
jgi:uncharacterized protein YeaO (DUF488 family)